MKAKRMTGRVLVFVGLIALGGFGAWRVYSPSRGPVGATSNSMMVIAPYWHSGTWVFDDPAAGLKREPFVGGVPKMIDVLVEDIPNAKDGFRLLFSANEFPGYHKKLTWLRGDSGGNYYRLDDPPMEGWICPALFKYYEAAPKEIYVRAEPLERKVSVDEAEPATKEKPVTKSDEGVDFDKLWKARLAALEKVLGKSDDKILTAVGPFYLGRPEQGAAADMLIFRKHLPGVVAVTASLIGDDRQKANELGNYELMICGRQDVKWGEGILSRVLSFYTLDVQLNPGDTMDIGPAVPAGSSIAGMLFLEYARFTVTDQPAGLMLCIGITKDELGACQAGRRAEVEAALKTANVYPYTDLNRKSVLAKK